jgi:GNAT superfamily N-acetyltransferase
MNVHVKELTLDNAAAIALLSGQLGYPSTTIESHERLAQILASNEDLVIGAFIEGKLVGWLHAFYSVRLESDPFCEIAGLVVEDSYRNSGLGKLLVEKAADWCIDKNCHELRVRSNIIRKDAHRFYLKLGFTEKKEQKVFTLSR